MIHEGSLKAVLVLLSRTLVYYKFKENVDFELTDDGGVLSSSMTGKEVHVDKERALFLKQLVGCTAKDSAIALSVSLEKNELGDKAKEDANYFRTIEIMNEFICAGFVERDLEAEERDAG